MERKKIKRILVQDPFLLRLICSKLTNLGYTDYVGVCDTQIAWNILCSEPFDLVICELNEAVLRSNFLKNVTAKFPNISVIVVGSGRLPWEDPSSLKVPGFPDIFYLPKPALIVEERLLTAIRTCEER